MLGAVVDAGVGSGCSLVPKMGRSELAITLSFTTTLLLASHEWVGRRASFGGAGDGVIVERERGRQEGREGGKISELESVKSRSDGVCGAGVPVTWSVGREAGEGN